MKVMAIDRFEYANKLRLPGDEFDTDNDDHARLLELAKRVKIVPEAKVMTTREMNVERKRNRYRHRQMKADE